ncbi:kinesin-like protein KIF18A isoform X2 [Xenopus laevis]|uniref:Kinesin-like protein n=1 Tax=Xenopus laevis TaxID=8355 RepID=A0A8J0V0A5_XENLA|nr:kinesin-like protein KIF18A isoform X2 [Xenopus laevis]
MEASQEDVCSHVRVVVRVRPENEKEKQGNFSRVVQVVDNHILVFDPKVEEVGFFHGRSRANRDITKRKNKDLKFVFDCVFDDSSCQLEVFEQTTKIVLDGVLNGYNCTVLAYGATGAGKTHTMLGSPHEPGVMYLTMMELYNRIDSVKEEKVCNVAISYLEVYNEQIRDLLSNSGQLAVREDAQKGVVVQGLTLHQPKSAEEILQMLDVGNKNRTQHPTDMNASSSRSHAVFQIYLRQQDKTASINQNVRIAKMTLIDLAGSERASATNAKGDRLREGTNINRSLLALGNVINALADPKSKKQHIPYRNSKLTRLLKDSLGGNCRTIMIAAVSPSSLSYDDTYNTLKYANRAKDIKSAVKSNVVSLDSHISQYVKICEQQKKEIAALKEKLKAYEEQKAAAPGKLKQDLLIPPSQNQAEIKRFQETLRCLFTNREEIRAEYLNVEMRFKENELKTHYQRQCLEQVQMLCSQEKAVKASCKRDHRVEVLKNQNVLLQKKKEDELKRLEENTSWLHRLESEMKLLNKDRKIPEELSKELQCHHLTVEVKDLKTQIQHMTRLVTLQERENQYNEKLINALLPTLRRQYLLLSQVGLTDATVEGDFKKIEQLVQREKAVVWADQTESDEPNKCGDSQISAVVTFPHLKSHQTTPSKEEKSVQLIQSAEKVAPKENPLAIVRHFTGALSSQSEEVKENVPQKPLNVVPPRKRTRRKLMDSPLSTASLQQDDSISDELAPIVYTPETSNNTVAILKQVAKIPCVEAKMENYPVFRGCGGRGGFSFPMTSESSESDMNSTVILSDGDSEKTVVRSHGAGEKSSVSTADVKPSTTSMLQRLGLSSLLNKPSSKPSYMAMTSAAERKRKLLSLAGNSAVKEDSVPLPTAKRVRQDIALDCKALRVQRVAGTTRSKDNCARRRLPKSVSEGALGVKTKPFSFQGSAQLLFQGGKKKAALKDP